jgi:hypothetical protein
VSAKSSISEMMPKNASRVSGDGPRWKNGGGSTETWRIADSLMGE